MKNKITIDFFHDVICSWCYVLSPRIRELVKEYPEVEVKHHSFALSFDESDTIRMFGSLENAKKEIMRHWRASNRRDNKSRIDADLMESRDFQYPTSINGLKGCKAAEIQGGQEGHWDYFDLVQSTHLTEASNIGDREVLFGLATKLGLDVDQFIIDFDSEEVLNKVLDDIALAKKWQVNSVPTIIINEKIKVPGAIEYSELKKLIESEIERIS